MLFYSNISILILIEINPSPKVQQVKVLKKVRDIDKSKILDLLKKVDKIKEEPLYLQGLF